MSNQKCNQKYYLATVETNWADEMDIDGHIAMTQKEHDAWRKRFDKIKFPVNIDIGTNQEFNLKKKEVEVKVQEISQAQYRTLVTLDLKERGFTQCIDIETYDEDKDADEEE